jgi:hypothetical protein
MDLSIIQSLEESLLGQLAKYQELIDFLEIEKQRLLNLDLDGLLVVGKAKEKLAKSIIKSGESLKDSILEAALMLKLPSDPLPTLAEIAKAVPGPFGLRLSDGASKLARLKNLILRENAMAKRFVEESLDLVTDSINILSGASQIKAEGYGSDGKKDKGVKKALPSKISREV